PKKRFSPSFHLADLLNTKDSILWDNIRDILKELELGTILGSLYNLRTKVDIIKHFNKEGTGWLIEKCLETHQFNFADAYLTSIYFSFPNYCEVMSFS